MKNFMNCVGGFIVIACFFSLLNVTILAMEPEKQLGLLFNNSVAHKREYLSEIFNPEVACKQGRPFDQVVPQDIKILPDGKRVAIARAGKVWLSSIVASKCELIIELPNANNCCPMVKTAQGKNGDIAVLAATNCWDEDTQRLVGEYGIYFEDSVSLARTRGDIKKLLDGTIQACALDNEGKMIVFAGRNSLSLIDRFSGEIMDIRPVVFDGGKGEVIVDLTICRDNTEIAVAGSAGTIAVLSFFKNLKQEVILTEALKAKFNMAIKNLHYISLTQLLCITNKGELVCVDINEVSRANGSDVFTKTFADPSLYDKVCCDSSGECVVVYWTSRVNFPEHTMCDKIEVRRKVADFSQQMIFWLPELQSTSQYITADGRVLLSDSYWVAVALHKDLFVGLRSDGKMISFHLFPKDNVIDRFDRFNARERAEKLVSESLKDQDLDKPNVRKTLSQPLADAPKKVGSAGSVDFLKKFGSSKSHKRSSEGSKRSSIKVGDESTKNTQIQIGAGSPTKSRIIDSGSRAEKRSTTEEEGDKKINQPSSPRLIKTSSKLTGEGSPAGKHSGERSKASSPQDPESGAKPRKTLMQRLEGSESDSRMG